jgi:hypothetical protein
MAKPKKKEEPIRLNMSFQDALKKALNTPLPNSENDKSKKYKNKGRNN